MKKIAVVLCVVFSFTIVAGAQVASKTVTNADLEKFRQKRTAAEQEYRETYAAKGLPSPEELKAQNEKRLRDVEELADKLRAEDLERQRLAFAAAHQRQAATRIYINNYPSNYPDDNTIYSYGLFGNGGFRRGFGNRAFGTSGLNGYAAGGMLWPTPIGEHTTTIFRRPIFRGRRH